MSNHDLKRINMNLLSTTPKNQPGRVYFVDTGDETDASKSVEAVSNILGTANMTAVTLDLDKMGKDFSYNDFRDFMMKQTETNIVHITGLWNWLQGSETEDGQTNKRTNIFNRSREAFVSPKYPTSKMIWMTTAEISDFTSDPVLQDIWSWRAGVYEIGAQDTLGSTPQPKPTPFKPR